VIRAVGGVLFLVGSLIMAFNLYMTVRSPSTAAAPEPRAAGALVPAE
jgi:cytochrome c oxidase cbb3-type subunit 1